MPKKATKHIPKKQAPIGAVKNGKLKVLDGESQTERWRQGTTGFSKDYDGDPIAVNYNKRDMKRAPRHHVHTGIRREKKYDVED